MITIRTATPADLEILAELSRTTFYDTFHAYNSAADMQLYLDEHLSNAAINIELNNPSNVFIVAEDGNTAVGYARLCTQSEMISETGLDALEISRLYCKQEFIGTGVGSALMAECVSIANHFNKQAICLGVWEHNKNAIDFYCRKGFEKTGEHAFMLGHDKQTDWIMVKYLKAI